MLSKESAVFITVKNIKTLNILYVFLEMLFFCEVPNLGLGEVEIK